MNEVQHGSDQALRGLDRLDFWVSANEQAFSSGPAGMAVIDEAGDIVRVNHSLCDLLGVDEADVLGQPMVRFAVPEHAAALRRWLTGDPEGHPPCLRGHRWVRRPDGSTLWLEGEIVRVATEDGHYALVTVQDRTAGRVTAEALRRSNEELEALVARAPVAIYKTDVDGRVIMWNTAAEQTFGWTADEVLGHRIPTVDAEQWGEFMAGHRRRLAGEAINGEAVLRRHRDGRSLVTAFWTAPVHDASGTPEAVLTVALDVTHEREATTALAESERRWRTMVQNISDTITVVDGHGKIVSTTGQTKDILGYPVGWWDDRHLFDLAHPDDLERATEMFELVKAVKGKELSAEIRARRRDGGWATLEITGVNLLDDPAVNGIVITTRNVTQNRRNQRLLANQARILENVAGGGSLDDTFQELVKMIQELMSGSTAQVLVPDGEQLVPRTPTPVVLSGDGVFVGTVLDPRTGVVQAVLAVDPHGHPITDGDERVLETAQRLISIAIERQGAEARLIHQGLHDQLTGLPNRTLLVDRLEHAVIRARHIDHQVAVLFIDLDRFKVVNDSLGHVAGDQLLTLFSERLRRLVRPEDTVARFGGDEFVVVCEHGNGPTVIVSIAERLERSMADAFRLDDGTDVFLTVSMGMAAGDTADAAGLLRNADAAMYRAKELGRNRLEVFDDAMRATALRRLTVGTDLRRAIERKELVVHYQPVLSIDGKVRGAEALVRWQHPDLGLLPPSHFISVAEEIGLVGALGEQVLGQALTDVTRWRSEPGDVPFILSTNLSARQVSEPGLRDRVQQALAQHSVDPRHLCLELTESVLMEDLDHVAEVLTDLKGLGIRLAIDDFGTGWSSLTYLHRLPVDQVKIDRSFVQDLGSQDHVTQERLAGADGRPRQGQAIVAAVLGMAHALGLEVVAEGVEDPRQLAYLEELGCDLAQGFLFSGPLPPDQFGRFLDRSRSAAGDG